MLNHGGTDLGAVGRHFRYLDRDGELVIETDHDEPIVGKKAAKAIIEDWDLELDALRPTIDGKL